MDIASPPDREKLVAEVFFDAEQWAEISQEQDDPVVEFYSRTDGKPWTFKYEDAMAALQIAKSRLIDGDDTEPGS